MDDQQRKLSSVRLQVATSLLIILAMPVKLQAADWPQFRGPQRNGISTETGLLDSWPKDGPQVAWRAALGQGYSGISASEGKLFTLFATDQNELAVAIDAATGKVLWRTQIDTAYKNDFGDGPRSTPTVDGDTVYVLGAKGKLLALSTDDGQQLWAQDLIRDHGARIPTWGVSTTPHVDGDLLLVDIGSPKAAILALNKKTGEPMWTSSRDTADLAGYAAPLSFSAQGIRHLLFFTGTQLLALAPEDGSLLWKIPWATSYDINAASPIFIAPDKVFASSGYGTGAAVFQMEVQNGSVAPREVWRSRVMKNQFSSSVYVDGSIYGFDDSTLKCIDSSSGAEQWKVRGFGHGSLTYADGHLYVLGDRGRLALIVATPEGYQQQGDFQVFESKAWTVPTVANGKLFLRNEEELLALAVKK